VSKNKLQKFAEMANFENVIQPKLDEVINKDYRLKGQWNSVFFKNNNPIILELGCGKGEYTLGLAQRFPNNNYLGVDIKGARIWKGSSFALQNGLKNVGFLRTRIEHIVSFFAPGEIAEIWITFPDPQEKRIRAKKRLTSPGFLIMYKQFLQATGLIHLKTDNEILFEYTCKVCMHNNFLIKFHTKDVYNCSFNEEVPAIKTFYESQFLQMGITIKYLSFQLNSNEIIKDPPEEEN
jgi:tRNA (guanine-N7-)-methyltransferase